MTFPVFDLPGELALGLRIFGCLLFGGAVAGKLRHIDSFLDTVSRYRLVPFALSRPAAWLIIGLEIEVVVALASGSFVGIGSASAAALLTGFALAIAINLARGEREIDCGCFQAGRRQPLGWDLVLRNLLLAALFLPLLAARPSPATALEWLDGFAGGLVLFVLYWAFSEIHAVSRAASVGRGRAL